MRRLVPLVVLVLILGCTRPPSGSTAPSVTVTESPAVPKADGPGTEGPEVGPMPREYPRRSTDEALTAGVAYLLAAQSPDGAWRSEVYATFRDGLALTPLAVVALQEAARAGVEPAGSAAARRKALEFLAKLVNDAGSIVPGPDGIDYPIYTAALTLQALCHPIDGKDFAKARTAWVKYLKERQLTTRLGWKDADKEYGGWGYCRVIPQKPAPGEFAPNLIESNLSATLFALEALKAAGELDPESAAAAAIFVRRCQNSSTPGNPVPWQSVLDGGFHFIYDDPTRNKAGMVAKDGECWPLLFHSYGSTTADGLRALDLCGTPEDQSRKSAAAAWLANHFRPDTHPGEYVKTYEPNREAVYYYYAASVAKALRDHAIAPAAGGDWATALATELASRQKRDGSWVNRVELVRENEPLVATSNAIIALARCKK